MVVTGTMEAPVECLGEEIERQTKKAEGPKLIALAGTPKQQTTRFWSEPCTGLCAKSGGPRR